MNIAQFAMIGSVIANLVDGPLVESAKPASSSYQYAVKNSPNITAAAQPSLQDQLDTLIDLFSAISVCWTPPPAEKAFQGIQVTVRFALRTDGTLVSEPRVSFLTPGIPEVVRALYRGSVIDSLNRCAPFPISPELGAAVAGRPLTARFYERRKTFQSI